LIPKRISLTNFICYREAALDFGGFRVACLAGPNGAGKSALLDALTWALWGRSRARRDDELIYFGQEEMAVEFVFDLGGQDYRILRRRRTGKRGSSLLEFQMDDGGDWRSISESSIRLTQAKIERVLRLDYPTFVNSAFLRQGRADEFTTKTAGERKRVLGDILGLDRWREYEDRAKERQAAIRSESELLEGRLREIDAEVALRSQHETALAAAQTTLAELGEVIQSAEAASRRMESARSELRHNQAQIADLARRIGEDSRELDRLAGERAMLEAQLIELESLLAEADAITAGYAGYLEAEQRERTLGSKLLHSVELTARQTDLEARILDARRELETRRDVILHHIADLERRVPAEAVVAERDAARAEVAHLRTLLDSRDAARLDLGSISEERAALRAQNEALRKDMVSLRDRIAQLEQAQARCPLCEQPLGDDHRQSLLHQFRDEGGAMGDRYRANQSADEALADQARGLERQIADVMKLVEPLDRVQRREAALSERIRSGEHVDEELVRARSELNPILDRLERKQFGLHLRQELALVFEQAAELGYERAAHRSARQAVADLRHFADQREQLASAEARRSESRSALQRVQAAESEWAERREAEELLRSQREKDAAVLREELSAVPEVEAELDRVRRQEADARQALGAAVQCIEACKALEQQREDRATRLRTLASSQADFAELRTAFGVRGVPAMIIEAAVPEIEAESNRLLARMTGGRMHVRLHTQRETQAGDVRETLEIAISDELGTRPYETYSGGEQYRINFAMRVALSKLLARRAGARLETLVIDEGFGTQDAEGRQRLVEAISVVQDDFARVLVITHIDELMDAFPVRIEVRKTPDGSVIEII